MRHTGVINVSHKIVQFLSRHVRRRKRQSAIGIDTFSSFVYLFSFGFTHFKITKHREWFHSLDIYEVT